MRRPLRILFFGEAVTLAHVVRPLMLARDLDRNEYEVALASDQSFRSLVEASEVPFFPIPTLRSEIFLERLSNGSPLYDRETLEEYVAAERALFAQFEPDLVVGDFRISLGISAEHAGVRYANLCHAHWSPYSTGSFPVPELPVVRALGADSVGWVLPHVTPLIFRFHFRDYNKLRRARGLAPVGSLHEMYTRGDWTLYLDTPSLAPTRNLPENHRYLGPLIWSPSEPLPNCWPEVKGKRPIVYISLGSSGDVSVVEAIIASLSKLPVFAFLATAGRVVVDLPDHIFASAYLPGTAILKEAALCIFNGGAATGYQALREGVPLLGFPSNADQFFHAEAIVRLGAGLVIRPSRATSENISNAVVRLLSSPSLREIPDYRACAAAIAREISAYPAVENFRQFLASIALVPQNRSRATCR